jgi:hypothetical protein
MKKILFALMVLSFSHAAMALDYELRLNMSTCEPDGIVSSWKERSNPRDFWVSQKVVLDNELERMRHRSVEQECSDVGTQSDRIRCMEYKKTIRQSAQRCLNVSRRRCRENGACLP